MKHTSNLFLILIIGSLFTVSCDRNQVYNSFTKMEDGNWSWDEPVIFEPEISDTAQNCDILIQLRHTTDYPLSNLYMFVHVDGPSGQRMTDTINFILARKSGEWIGKGIGHLREIGYMYKREARFPENGTYRFTVEQAMRLEEVPVTEVGLLINSGNS